MIRNKLLSILREVTSEVDIHIEEPVNPSFGDYSTNMAMILAKNEGKNPREVAEGLVSKLEEDKELIKIIEKIEIAGPGFINFTIKQKELIDALVIINISSDIFKNFQTGDRKTVVIDYSSPNIAKPFGIGHLRSTVIGQAIYNLYKTLGYNVIGDNHLGDWGTQFGKLLYMIDSKKVTDLSIENLEKLYVEFHELATKDESLEEKAREWFKKLEDGDSVAHGIWRRCVNVSLNEFQKVYDLLGVKIDNAFGESFYEEEMKNLLKDPKVKAVLTKGEDGKSQIVDLTSVGIKTPLMFLKSDGATTYATRDLATLKFRIQKWNPDIIIYEVGAEQTLHFRQVFETAKLMGIASDKVNLVHTKHGLYLAPDGKKFSTRKGKTIKLEEVLTEAIDKAKKLGSEDEKVARDVGIGAIKYFDLMHSVTSDVVFDWEKIMNMEGNSGPYLQYTNARINSVLEKAGSAKKDLSTDNLDLTKEELLVLRSLIKFGDVIVDSANNFAPNILCNYLYNLASSFNTFYNKHKIIGSDNEEFRLKLANGVGVVLKKGLQILGINTPERM